jgi:hypothetical protein
MFADNSVGWNWQGWQTDEGPVHADLCIFIASLPG